jgi:hypothetical protein
MRNHVNVALSDLRTGISSRMMLTDFAERLLSLANDAAAAREYAAQTSFPRPMLEAVREEASVLATLMDRLGIDEAEQLEVSERPRP